MAQQILEASIPTCPKCQLAIEDNGAPTRSRAVRPTRLYKKVDVLAAARDANVDLQRYKHAARRSGLRHFYRLPKSERVECAFTDRTPHLWGYVVETACGLVLNVGHQCGARCIEGFDEVREAAHDAESEDNHVVRLEREPQSAKVRLETVIAWLERAAEFREALRRHAAWVEESFVERFTANRRDVPVQRSGGGAREIYRQLQGLELFDRKQSPRDLIVNARRALADVDEVVHARKGLSATGVYDLEMSRKLLRRVSGASSVAQNIELWIQRVALFFTEANFHVAVIAAKRTDTWSVVVRNGVAAFLIDVNGVPHTLGMGGLRPAQK